MTAAHQNRPDILPDVRDLYLGLISALHVVTAQLGADEEVAKSN